VAFLLHACRKRMTQDAQGSWLRYQSGPDSTRGRQYRGVCRVREAMVASATMRGIRSGVADLLRAGAVGAIVVASTSGFANAESISGALAKAYVFNPELNAARASTRAIDENVARAK